MKVESKAREIINYSFLVAFANDGIIDQGELAFIKNLAFKDGILDDEEKQALKRIFSRMNESQLTPQQRKDIQEFCQEYDIT